VYGKSEADKMIFYVVIVTGLKLVASLNSNKDTFKITIK